MTCLKKIFNTAMDKFEYKIIDVAKSGNDFDFSEQTFNKLGEEGWELCDCVSGRAIFKRLKKDVGAEIHANDNIFKIGDEIYTLTFYADNSAPCGNCAFLERPSLVCVHPCKAERKCKCESGYNKGWNTWEYTRIP